jgi:ATP-binding cassette subfamily B protein
VAEAPTSTWESLVRRRVDRPIRELPSLVREAVRLVMRAARRQWIASIGLSALIGVLTSIQLVLTRDLLGHLLDIESGSGISGLGPTLVAFVVAFTIASVAQLSQSELRRLVGEKVGRHAQVEVATAAARVELVDFDRPGFHDLLQRASANASTRPVQVSYALITIITSGLTAAGIIVGLAVVEPILLALVLLAFGPVWLLTRQLSRLAYKFDVDQTEADRRRNYIASLMMSKRPAKEVRSFDLAPYFLLRLRELWDARLVEVEKLVRKRIRVGILGRLANGLLLALVVVVLAWLLDSGRTSASDAAVAGGALMLLNQRFGATVGAFGQLYECSLFLRDVRAFFEFGHSPRPGTFGTQPAEPLVEIVADDLRFTYPSSPGEVIRGVSVRIGHDEVVALVGANGSGKTTLAKLLANVYRPDSGDIRWNGVDVDELDRSQLALQIAPLFQDFEQYLFTASDNVGLGRVESIDDRTSVEAAAERAGAASFISGLPAGYDSLLGPEFYGGSDLSIGQWQRIALARAFMRDASLVILDEPTAALDPEAEAALFERLRELCAGRGVLVISHRFSTVTSADRIYVMDSGRVIEEGTHAQLMALGGTYHRLFSLQASQYREPDEVR